MSDIFKPYPSPLYRLPRIRDLLEAPLVERPVIIRKLVEGFKGTSAEINDDKDGAEKGKVQRLINDFKEIPAEHVYGDSINTQLPIQDNERAYYDTLVDFTRHHIHAHNKNLHKDLDEEQLEEQTSADFNIGVMPAGIRLYLEKLLSAILRYQYFHTGVFSEVHDLFKEDDEDDESASNSFDENSDNTIARKMYFRTIADSRLIQSDADLVLNEYLLESAKTQGCSVYAEAVLKLMRWGHRKPNMLIVGDSNPNTFDLENMRSITSTIDYSKLTPVAEEGRTYQVHGYVTVPVQHEGLSRETVALLLMNQMYTNPHDSSPLYLFSAISVPDFISEYRTNDKIIGVTYNGSKFVVEEDYRPIAQYNLSDTVTNHSYIQTAATMDTLMTLDIRSGQSPAFVISHSNSLAGYAVNVSNPIADELLPIAEPERLNALYDYWYQHFVANCHIVDTSDLQEILDAYHGVAQVATPTSENVADFAYEMMFNDKPKLEEEEEKFDMNKTIYAGDISALKFKPVSANKSNAFAVAATPDNGWVYASLNEVNISPMTEAEKPLQHTFIMLSIFANLSGGAIPIKASFVSESSLVKIMNSLIKQ